MFQASISACLFLQNLQNLKDGIEKGPLSGAKSTKIAKKNKIACNIKQNQKSCHNAAKKGTDDPQTSISLQMIVSLSFGHVQKNMKNDTAMRKASINIDTKNAKNPVREPTCSKRGTQNRGRWLSKLEPVSTFSASCLQEAPAHP